MGEGELSSGFRHKSHSDTYLQPHTDLLSMYDRNKLCNLYLDRVGQIVWDYPGLEDQKYICEKATRVNE